MPGLLGEFAFHGQVGASAKCWHTQKLLFGKKKALKNSTRAIDPGTQILLMGDEERRGIPKGMAESRHFQSQFLPPRTHFSEPNPKRVIPCSHNASGPTKSELMEELRDILITDLAILCDLSWVTRAIYPSAVIRDLKQKGSTGSIYRGDSEVV